VKIKTARRCGEGTGADVGGPSERSGWAAHTRACIAISIPGASRHTATTTSMTRSSARTRVAWPACLFSRLRIAGDKYVMAVSDSSARAKADASRKAACRRIVVPDVIKPNDYRCQLARPRLSDEKAACILDTWSRLFIPLISKKQPRLRYIVGESRWTTPRDAMPRGPGN